MRPQLNPSMLMADCCTVRQARKSYTCEAGRHAVTSCTRQINRGDYYVECRDQVPAYASGARYCLACARAPQGPLGGVVIDDQGA